MPTFIDKVNRLSFKKTLLILITIFLFSVIIRIPNLNRPLSSHHEWLTAVSLRIAEIYDQAGAKAYHFNPVMTYPGLANKNIDNTAVSFSLQDKTGNYYYTSYPPLFYLTFYYSFKLLGASLTILNTQIFNLFLHFICAFFIFLIISLIFNKKNNLAAILGFSLYIFLPLNLWFHSNVIMTEIFVQLIYVIGIYVFLKLNNNPRPIYFWLLGIINFLFCYTEWLGFFFAATIFIYALGRIKRDKNSQIILIIIAFSSIAALLLTIGQYSQIDGFLNYFQSAQQKFQLRSGFSALARPETLIYNFSSLKILTVHYLIGFGGFIFAAIALFIYKFINKNKQLDRASALVLCLAFFPILLHHLIFFSGTVIHDFFLLKDSLFISIFLAIYLPQYLKKTSVIILIILSFFASIAVYSLINADYDVSPKVIGEKIRYYSAPDEVIFLNTDNNYIEPHLIYYAKRNVASFQSMAEAKNLIKLNGLSKGIVFFLNENNNNVEKIIRLNINE